MHYKTLTNHINLGLLFVPILPGPYRFFLLKSNKHKIVQKAALTSSKVNSFFTPLKANNKSLKLATKKVTSAFYTFMHNHSFNPMTCTVIIKVHNFMS